MEKEINIIPPTGYVIDESKSTLGHIVFKKENKFVTSWSNLGTVEGYYIDENSKLSSNIIRDSIDENKNIFAFMSEAIAALALAQLSQLKHSYNCGWKPNWSEHSRKYIITFKSRRCIKATSWDTPHFLAFETEVARDTFLSNFEDLIMQAKIFIN